MRILVLERYPDNRLGGQERSLSEVCKGLAEKGVRIWLAYVEEGNLVPLYREFCEGMIVVPGPFFLNLKSSLGFVTTLLRLARLNRSADWNAIYINQYFDSSLAVALGVILRLPVVCHLRLAPGPYISRQYRLALRRCRFVIAVSNFIKQQYVAEGLDPSKVKVVYNGTDLNYFSPRPRLSLARRRILYLGRIHPSKGIETLIDACRMIFKQRGDVVLTLAGNSDRAGQHARYDLIVRQKALDMGGAIEFIEHQTDVRALLASADVVVLPSQCGEAFGRVLIEAMGMAIPVVATRDGGIPEVFGEQFQSCLVPPSDPPALAEAILQVMDWREARPELGFEFRHHVEQHFPQGVTHERVFEVLNHSIVPRQRCQ